MISGRWVGGSAVGWSKRTVCGQEPQNLKKSLFQDARHIEDIIIENAGNSIDLLK